MKTKTLKKVINKTLEVIAEIVFALALVYIILACIVALANLF
jgi:hypothetical protein